MISSNAIYSGNMEQGDKDEILEAFLRSTSQTLGRLGCNMIANYSSADAYTITNTTYADTANMSAGVQGSGGVVLVICKLSGGMGTAVSAYAQLLVDNVKVDETRVGSAGGLTNGSLFILHAITDTNKHAVKVQTKVDSGTWTGVSRKFYIIEILRG